MDHRFGVELDSPEVDEGTDCPCCYPENEEEDEGPEEEGLLCERGDTGDVGGKASQLFNGRDEGVEDSH